MDRKTRIETILELLAPLYPGIKTELHHHNPFELLVATILSAQSTDVQINKITPQLFRKYPTPESMADADMTELEQAIKSSGFYKAKAKNIKKASEILVSNYGSNIPKTMEALLTLPGVARKTANVVLSVAYDINEGIAVDTHVIRLSSRLDISDNKDPKKIERDLMAITDKSRWSDLSNFLVLHGRYVCKAKKPDCNNCVLNQICPSAFMF